MLTAESRARDFPSLAGMHYLNSAAESIPPLCVQDALQAYWHDKQQGMRGRDGHFAVLAQCREISAQWLGLTPDEVSFCSCRSEAYNLLASALNLQHADEVVVNDLDFPSGATPWLAAPTQPAVKVWRSRAGALDAADLLPLLNAKTRLVQVSLISFYNGFRLDWQAFHDAVRQLAPQALISVDVTQALGRVALDCAGADCIISSTHKWVLGLHGGCIVGVPEARAAQLTTRAGGWLQLSNAFDADRFERLGTKPGAASWSVGMPNFAAIYALNAGLRYLGAIGVDAVARAADPLTQALHAGLLAQGITPMAPRRRSSDSGIVAFQHPRSDAIHSALQQDNIHVMHQAGRLRMAVHGYNTAADITRFLNTLDRALHGP
jgi:selenocysteine lyase/cysteine desulfurase